MAAIKSRGTKPEMFLRRALHSAGYRFTANVRGLPGRPDLVFSKKRIVVFVNGCFWHCHACRWGQVAPSTNAEFWKSKRSATVTRDKLNVVALETLGWRVLSVWECELRHDPDIARRVGVFLGPARSTE